LRDKTPAKARSRKSNWLILRAPTGGYSSQPSAQESRK
jgi:hypothetical protein